MIHSSKEVRNGEDAITVNEVKGTTWNCNEVCQTSHEWISVGSEYEYHEGRNGCTD
jgi:hypothetical protein